MIRLTARAGLIAVALLIPVGADACLQFETGPTETLRVIVTGLSPGATSGGSVTVTRTDVAAPPLVVPIPGRGRDSVGVPAGTYSVSYGAPPGHIRAPGTVNPRTTQVVAGQGATVSFQVQVVTGFAPADLLNNASFETGWNGFVDWSYRPLPSPASGLFSITRSQDVAYDGAWSARSTFGPTLLDNRVYLAFPFGNHLDTYVRAYFYIFGSVPNNHHKWIRFQTTAFNGVQGGLYLASSTGGVTWCDVASRPNSNVDIPLGIGIPTFNTWHSIEVEYDRTAWDSPHGPRVRFWYDGTAAVGSNPPGTAFWGDDAGAPNVNGPWLYIGAPSRAASPSAILSMDDTYNAGNTNSGAFYYDRIAISTQRIGP
jgi:hypothetical protein